MVKQLDELFLSLKEGIDQHLYTQEVIKQNGAKLSTKLVRKFSLMDQEPRVDA